MKSETIKQVGFNANQVDVNKMDNFNKDMMEVEFEHSTVDNSLFNSDNSNLPSMIIEELDENAISSMNVDINEFVEVKTLQIQEVKELIPKYKLTSICNSKDVKDMEDQDILLTADEEHQLTKQFLNGELTFSEYSSRMDQNVDLDITENDNIRYDNKNKYVSLRFSQLMFSNVFLEII